MSVRDVHEALLRVFRKSDVPDGTVASRCLGNHGFLHEFAVLLEDVETPEEIEQVTARMREVVAEPIAFEGREVCVTSSIGVALYPRDGKTVSALIAKADLAMYQAKKLGRNAVQFYTPDLAT